MGPGNRQILRRAPMNYEPVLILDMQIIMQTDGKIFSSKSASFVCEKCVQNEFGSCPRLKIAEKFQLPPEVYKAAEYVDLEEVEQPNYRSPCERILYALGQMGSPPEGISFGFHILFVFVEIMKQNLKERAWVDDMGNLTERYKTWLLAKFKKNLNDLMVDQNMKLFSKEKLTTLKLFCRCNGIPFNSLKLRSALPPTQVFRNNYKKREGVDYVSKSFLDIRKRKREVGYKEEARGQESESSDRKHGRLGAVYAKKQNLLGSRARMDVPGANEENFKVDKPVRVKREDLANRGNGRRVNQNLKYSENKQGSGLRLKNVKTVQGKQSSNEVTPNTKKEAREVGVKEEHLGSEPQIKSEVEEKEKMMVKKEEYPAQPVHLIRKGEDYQAQRFDINNLNYDQQRSETSNNLYNGQTMDLLTTVSPGTQFPNPELPQRRRGPSQPASQLHRTVRGRGPKMVQQQRKQIPEKLRKPSKEETGMSQCLESESHYAPSALVKNFPHNFSQNSGLNSQNLNSECGNVNIILENEERENLGEQMKPRVEGLLGLPEHLGKMRVSNAETTKRKSQLGKGDTSEYRDRNLEAMKNRRGSGYGKFQDLHLPSLNQMISSNEREEYEAKPETDHPIASDNLKHQRSQIPNNPTDLKQEDSKKGQDKQCQMENEGEKDISEVIKKIHLNPSKRNGSFDQNKASILYTQNAKEIPERMKSSVGNQSKSGTGNNFIYINMQHNHFEIKNGRGLPTRPEDSASMERASKKISELDGLLNDLVNNLTSLKDYVLQAGMSDTQMKQKGIQSIQTKRAYSLKLKGGGQISDNQ